MIYNINTECTYHSPEVFLETDSISENERQFVRDCLYRQEMLNIFNLEEFDEAIINEKTHMLYEKIKDVKEFVVCMEYVLQKMNMPFSNELEREVGLYILLSYDYLYLFHLSVCEFLRNGKIENTPLELFIRKDVIVDNSIIE